MKKLAIIPILFALVLTAVPAQAAEQKNMLVHLKTSLKHDDAQICVAYNIIWAALEEGLKVKVLVDADAANTFKIGWRGKDDIQGYELPDNLRQALSKQFEVPLNQVPQTYGDFLNMLHQKGAEFYINSAFLIVSKIEGQLGTVENISGKFFKPISLQDIIRLRTRSDFYMAY